MRRIIGRTENGRFVSDASTPDDTARLLEMIRTRTPPGTVGTDKAFLERRQNGEQFATMAPPLARQTIEAARKAGISISGKVYMPSLADTRGAADPQAWVSDRSDVLKVCQQRNYRCEGAVNYEPPPLPPKKRTRLADDLVQEAVVAMCRKNPELKRKPKRELHEMAIEKHAPKFKGD